MTPDISGQRVSSATELLGHSAVFHGPGMPFSFPLTPIRKLSEGEVLVKNVYTTICGSDLHTFCGIRHEPCPTVLGHEIVGQIMEMHPGHPGTDFGGAVLQPGDLVTWSIFASDPLSANARQGIPQKGDGLFKYGHARVEHDEIFHGGLSEYCILKNHTAILKIPQDLPIPLAATLNCAIATVAGALRLAGNMKGKNVLITGMGLLGLTCAAMCREAGAYWIAAADISEKRLEDACSFGADTTILSDANENNLKQIILQQTGKKGADFAFDMSGAPYAMESGLQSLGIGGKAIWVGGVFDSHPVQLDAQYLIRNLLEIKGLHNYNYDDFKYALDFMSRCWRQFPFEKVVEKDFPLNDAQAAFEYAIVNKPLRVGIKF